MKKSKGVLSDKIGIVSIIILILVTLGLIFVLNIIDSKSNPFIETEEAPAFKNETEKEFTRDMYLDLIERYKDLELDDISQDEAKEENIARVISRESEDSKDSISFKIDALVAKAEKK